MSLSLSPSLSPSENPSQCWRTKTNTVLYLNSEPLLKNQKPNPPMPGRAVFRGRGYLQGIFTSETSRLRSLNPCKNMLTNERCLLTEQAIWFNLMFFDFLCGYLVDLSWTHIYSLEICRRNLEECSSVTVVWWQVWYLLAHQRFGALSSQQTASLWPSSTSWQLPVLCCSRWPQLGRVARRKKQREKSLGIELSVPNACGAILAIHTQMILIISSTWP